MCRVRNTHSTPPWTTAYICITIDDSCLDQDGNFLDKPMTVRMVQWQPYCVKIPFGKKTPVCAACKRTNRTRSFCRERHKHRHLPWCTVYVLLSSLDAADPSTVVAGPSHPVEGAAEEREQRLKQKQEQEDAKRDEKASVNKDESKDEKEGSNNQNEQAGDTKQEDKSSEAKVDPIPDDRTISSDPGDQGDDINDIPESRTFLAKVSCRSISIHWLELSEFDSSEVASFPVAPDPHGQYHSPGMVDPNALYYGHPHQHPGMGYAAQQHQNALKSRQQYFFQMQQHHQQHYGQQPPPPPPPPQAWPPAHHYGDGTTAGEAAAAQQQQQQPPPPPPQWAMYYPGHYPPPPVPEGGMPEGQTGATPPHHHLQQQHHHHQPPPEYGAPATPMAAGGGPVVTTPVVAENGTGTADQEQPDPKRQRV